MRKVDEAVRQMLKIECGDSRPRLSVERSSTLSPTLKT
jgi:hypothetical protein